MGTGGVTIDGKYYFYTFISPSYKIGDIILTNRTDLGEDWALCDGGGDFLPDFISDDFIENIGQSSQDFFFYDKDKTNDYSDLYIISVVHDYMQDNYGCLAIGRYNYKNTIHSVYPTFPDDSNYTIFSVNLTSDGYLICLGEKSDSTISFLKSSMTLDSIIESTSTEINVNFTSLIENIEGLGFTFINDHLFIFSYNSIIDDSVVIDLIDVNCINNTYNTIYTNNLSENNLSIPSYDMFCRFNSFYDKNSNFYCIENCFINGSEVTVNSLLFTENSFVIIPLLSVNYTTNSFSQIFYDNNTNSYFVAHIDSETNTLTIFKSTNVDINSWTWETYVPAMKIPFLSNLSSCCNLKYLYQSDAFLLFNGVYFCLIDHYDDNINNKLFLHTFPEYGITTPFINHIFGNNDSIWTSEDGQIYFILDYFSSYITADFSFNNPYAVPVLSSPAFGYNYYVKVQ